MLCTYGTVDDSQDFVKSSSKKKAFNQLKVSQHRPVFHLQSLLGTVPADIFCPRSWARCPTVLLENQGHGLGPRLRQ